jgi:glycosyltransferase involved in cell wall biosynthesis
MEHWPRISIVTPSFNQGHYIAETIESVLAQAYPNLEHIVIDGGSTDETLTILQRYPDLKYISEPDRGQADAINKGFRLASGDIWGYLNSDDTLLPGALQRVAQEINPSQGRHIVMGRCRFTDEQSRYIGVEHPSHFESHRRVLEVWKGYQIPQPAIFWTPEVWQTCGPMAENLTSAWLDYDLFCRFSQKYRFHFVDQILATYRLHLASKTQLSTEAQRLEECIQISRRYWGQPWSLTYGQLSLSLARYRLNRVGRGRNLLKQAQEAKRNHRWTQALLYAVGGTALAPDVAFYVLFFPFLRDRSTGLLAKFFQRLAARNDSYPQTTAYLNNTNPWADQWVGPCLVISQEGQVEADTVIIQGWIELKYLNKPQVLTVYANGEKIGQQRITQSGDFEIQLPLPRPTSPGLNTIEIQASTWFVPHHLARNGDYRPLAWKTTDVQLCSR